MNFMLKYTGELYARFGRKYIPTSKTGSDWDRMEKELCEMREKNKMLRAHLSLVGETYAGDIAEQASALANKVI